MPTVWIPDSNDSDKLGAVVDSTAEANYPWGIVVLVMEFDECFRGIVRNVMNLDIVVKQPTWILSRKDVADFESGFTADPGDQLSTTPGIHFFEPTFAVGFTAGDDFDLAQVIVEFPDIDERHSTAGRAAFGRHQNAILAHSSFFTNTSSDSLPSSSKQIVPSFRFNALLPLYQGFIAAYSSSSHSIWLTT